MAPLRFVALAAVLTVAIAAAPARAVETAECGALVARADQAQSDVDALSALEATARRDCPIDVATAVARRLGFALFNAARIAPESERVGLLKRAADFAKDWRVLAALGAEQLREGDRTGAAENLQTALLILQEDPPAPPPPREIVERLLAMANNARAAASTYVKAQGTRSGAPGGVAADQVAGVEIMTVPFPIEFVFNEVTPTEDGAFAIADLAGILAAEGGGVVVLAGHTDPVGDDGYNLILSERRAKQVRDILIGSGAAQGVEIRIVGCGERSPPEIVSPEFYSEAEIHQIMRRVELVRSGNPCR